MGAIFEFIASALSFVLRFIYEITSENYGLSIIIFTIISKIMLFPITYKQTKAMEEMKKIAPLEKEIREKYKGNKEKISEELTRMYSEQKVNPFASCLPLLIQFPIIIAMFYIVRQPLTYMIQMPIDEIKTYSQKENISDQEIKSLEIQIAKDNNLINMNFAKINFGDTPSHVLSSKIEEDQRPSKFILAIPIISTLLAFAQMIISQKNSNLTKEQKEKQKTMSLMLPFLSGYISYIMPVALGIYWITGSVLQIIIQIIMEKFVKKPEKILLKEG